MINCSLFFSRLQFLYSNKLFADKLDKIFVFDLMKNCHLNSSDSNTMTGIDFSFLVVCIKERANNFFWMPFTDFCHPCAIHYDYIAKIETQKEDAEYIFKEKLHAADVPVYGVTKQSTKRNLVHFAKLTMDLAGFLMKRHEAEMSMYGYTFDWRTLVADCEYEDHKCC